MKRKKFPKTITLIAFLIFLFSGCDLFFKPDIVQYSVTGTASSVNITLNNATGGTEQYSDVPLPWEKEYSDFQDWFLYLSAQNQGSSGTVIVEIYHNGKLIDSAASSGAYVIATASGSISSNR
jgi:hypothetical protein